MVRTIITCVAFAAQGVSAHAVTLAEAIDVPLEEVTGDWIVASDSYRTGGLSAKCSNSGESDSSSVMTLTLDGAGTFSYKWRVSSEDSYDYLYCFVDGVCVLEVCGNSGAEVWGDSEPIVFETEEPHTIMWMYTKDVSADRGEDAAWIDAVEWKPVIPRFTYRFIDEEDPSKGIAVTAAKYVEGADLQIPSELDGYRVVAIDNLFAYDFDNLNVQGKITIPGSVEMISSSALECIRIANFEVANSNAIFSSDAFGNLYDKGKTTLIRAGSALDAGSSYALPASVRNLDMRAYRLLRPAHQITVTGGANITNITLGAFSGCENISFTISADNAYYCTPDSGTILNKDRTILVAQFDVTSDEYDYVVPLTVTNIAYQAFAGNQKLRSIFFHDGVQVLEPYAFIRTTALKEFVLPKNVREIVSLMMMSTSLERVIVPDGSILEHVYDMCFLGCDNLKEVVLGEKVCRISTNSFSDCGSLTNITFKGLPPNSSGLSNSINHEVTGYYRQKYAAEWSKVIGTNGKWDGLPMVMIEEEVENEFFKKPLDLILLVDATSGTSEGVAGTIGAFIGGLESGGVTDWRAKVVGYGDYFVNASEWLTDSAFVTNSAALAAQVTALPTLNGGDGPESMLDAIAQAVEMDYREGAERVVVAFTDTVFKPTGTIAGSWPTNELDYVEEKYYDLNSAASKEYFVDISASAAAVGAKAAAKGVTLKIVGSLNTFMREWYGNGQFEDLIDAANKKSDYESVDDVSAFVSSTTKMRGLGFEIAGLVDFYDDRKWVDGKLCYRLVVVAEDGGRVTGGEDEWYADGSKVVLRAKANENYHFAAWEGDLERTRSMNGNHILLVWMDRPRSINATFETMSRAIGKTAAFRKAVGVDSVEEAETIAASTVTRKGTALWQEYLVGTDPNDENDKFTASITFDADGKPQITWSPALNGEGVKEGVRVYTVYGKKTLVGEWEEVSTGKESEYNFFKVGVELP